MARPAVLEDEPAAPIEFTTLLNQNISAAAGEKMTPAVETDSIPDAQAIVVVASSVPILSVLVVETSLTSPITKPQVTIAGWGFVQGSQYSLLLSSNDRNVTFTAEVTATSDLSLFLDLAEQPELLDSLQKDQGGLFYLTVSGAIGASVPVLVLSQPHISEVSIAIAAASVPYGAVQQEK